MAYEEQRLEIIGMAEKLLEDGTASTVLSYASGGVDGKAVPRFFTSPEELGEMRWDEGCTPNLAPYLMGRKNEKIAIIAKSCDSRIIVMYLQEGQINRENVHIIGVECAGMKGNDGRAAAGCGECAVRTPPLSDALVKNSDIPEIQEEKIPKTEVQKGETLQAKIPERDSLQTGIPEREGDVDEDYSLRRFQQEIDKCMLCFACRQACYGCYCETCFIERSIPNWLPSDLNAGTKMVFHLGRAMHLAGRCVECGACERVCPSGVKIRYLIRELNKMNRELYGLNAGMDLNEPSALAAFDIKDREVGFLGGDKA